MHGMALRVRAGVQDLRVGAGAATVMCLCEVARRTLAAAHALRARHAPPQPPASPQPLASPLASPQPPKQQPVQQQQAAAMSPPDSLGRVASLGTWLQPAKSAPKLVPGSPASFSFGSPAPAAAAATPATAEAPDVRAANRAQLCTPALTCALPALSHL
jgi:hypothetical protein